MKISKYGPITAIMNIKYLFFVRISEWTCCTANWSEKKLEKTDFNGNLEHVLATVTIAMQSETDNCIPLKIEMCGKKHTDNFNKNN